MKERRKFVRVDTPILIEYKHPKTRKTERSFTHDVSQKGMRFPSNVAFNSGDTLRLELGMPPHEEMMGVKAHVVWVREIAQYTISQFEIGVTFEWEERHNQMSLAKYLKSLVVTQET